MEPLNVDGAATAAAPPSLHIEHISSPDLPFPHDTDEEMQIGMREWEGNFLNWWEDQETPEWEGQDDLVLQVLSFLDVSDVVRSKRINKRWQQLCTRTIEDHFKPRKRFHSTGVYVEGRRQYLRGDVAAIDELACSYGYPMERWDLSKISVNSPAENDVILGRSRHRGNIAYITKIEEVVLQYINLQRKEEKLRMAEDIVRFITRERKGRFLRLDRGNWVVMSERQARYKTVQKLRIVRSGRHL
jgi:hypothetical protein